MMACAILGLQGVLKVTEHAHTHAHTLKESVTFPGHQPLPTWLHYKTEKELGRETEGERREMRNRGKR